MTVRVVAKVDAEPRQLAEIYAQLAEAATTLRAAVDASEGVLPVASVLVLERLRQRVSAVAGEVGAAFLEREPLAPFGNVADPRRWLRWLAEQAGGQP